MEPSPYLQDFNCGSQYFILDSPMNQPHSFGQIWKDQLPAGEPAILAMTFSPAGRERLTGLQRAERLYRTGELAAAADLPVKETIQ